MKLSRILTLSFRFMLRIWPRASAREKLTRGKSWRFKLRLSACDLKWRKKQKSEHLSKKTQKKIDYPDSLMGISIGQLNTYLFQTTGVIVIVRNLSCITQFWISRDRKMRGWQWLIKHKFYTLLLLTTWLIKVLDVNDDI